MAIQTWLLKTLIDNDFDIGLKDYEIYVPKDSTEEEVRNRLNKKIINHFMFREIGFETPQLFKFKLNTLMDEIMPYYNQLYESEDLEYNPLYNIELVEEFTNEITDKGKNTGQNTSTSTGDNISKNIDTPKSGATDSDLKNNKYISGADINSSNDSVNSNSTLNSENNRIEKYTRETKGSSAGLSFSKAVAQWRKVMLNIDKQIIDELEILFFMIY